MTGMADAVESRAGTSDERVFISIGSNAGGRGANCSRAIEALSEASGIEVVAESPLYETEPWGNTDQPAFVNSAVEIRTTLSPSGLLEYLKALEHELGRVPTYRWGPRVLDLDIVFFGSRVVDTERLKVPHPFVSERAFVLVPLADIAPGFAHPVTHRTVAEMLATLRESSSDGRLGVQPYPGD